MRVSLLRGLIAALCALCLSAPVLAKHVSVDFGPVFGSGGDGDDFGTNSTGDGTACTPGSSGPESCPLTLVNDASSGAIALGFPIDFGSGPVTSLFVNENGIVSFNAPLSISSSSFSNLSGLGQPVIAPYFADLTSVTFVGTVFDMAGTTSARSCTSAAPHPRRLELMATSIRPMRSRRSRYCGMGSRMQMAIRSL